MRVIVNSINRYSTWRLSQPAFTAAAAIVGIALMLISSSPSRSDLALSPGLQRNYGRALVDTSRSFTISATFNLNSLNGNQTIVSQSGNSTNAFYLGKDDGDDRLTFRVAERDQPDAQTRSISTDFVPTPGQWYILTGVYDSATQTIRLYCNSTRIGSAGYVDAWKSLGPTIVGGETTSIAGSLSNPINGTVSDLRLYSRALTDAQVARYCEIESSKIAPESFTWTNPIYYQGNGAGDDIHDPDIIHDGNMYYLVATLSPFTNFTDRDPTKPDYGSSPGISLYSSKDLKVWKFDRWLYNSSDIPESAPYKNQFWAPEMHKIGGRFYIIFGASNWIDSKYNVNGKMNYYQFIGVSDQVTGPYLHTTTIAGPGVDTSLFVDDDGKTYVVWPWNEIHSIDLSQIDDGLVTVGPKISQTTTPAQFTANGHDWRSDAAVEGPYMIKHAGTYYSLYACNYGGVYSTGVSMSTSIKGPWTLDPRGPVFAGGHQSEFIGPDGNWWACYKHEHSDTTPWLSIDPIVFDSSGFINLTPSDTPQRKRLANN